MSDNLFCYGKAEQVTLTASWLLNEIKVPHILPITDFNPGFIG
jgi:hypothetical protein